MLRFMTAGESHGPCLTAILEGIPAGVRIDAVRVTPDAETPAEAPAEAPAPVTEG